MPRRPPLAALALLLLAGCTDVPESDPFSFVPRTAVGDEQQVCAAVTRAVPRSLGEARQRPVVPDPERVVVWGRPAIVLYCAAELANPRDAVYTFDGVRWAMHDIGGFRRWTTVDGSVPVEVTIPDAYDAQAELLGGLAVAVRPALS